MKYENIDHLKSVLQKVYIDGMECFAARGFDTSYARPTTVLQHKENRTKPFYEKEVLQKIDGSIVIPFIFNVKQGGVNSKFFLDWMRNEERKYIYIGGFEIGDYGIILSNGLITNVSDGDNLNNGWMLQSITVEYQDRTEDEIGLLFNLSLEIEEENDTYKGSKLINATVID